MQASESSIPEAHEAALLAAYDDALAHGRSPGLDESALQALALAGSDLREDLACLELLDRRWPRRQTSAPDASALPPALAVGLQTTEQLGRFRVLCELGRGGHGIVFLAFDPALDRQVALKVPRPEVLLDPQMRQRFLREAHTVAGLDHPNLVPVYEAGEEGLTCYIASAYCPGKSLADWLGEQTAPMDARQAARLVAQTAEAVQYMHSRGVLHRDLKPANVLLTGEGHTAELCPRITDFGLAKQTRAGTDPAMTETGAILGTPAYMAPEQAAGRTRDVSTATDVYALGVILYECLTGRPPFSGTDKGLVLQRVLQEEPVSPRRLRPGLARDLETICLKCLQKDPAQRYGSAGELAADLNAWLEGRPLLARRHRLWEQAWLWCRRRPMTAAFFGLLVVALTAAGAAAWIHLRHLRDYESSQSAGARQAALAEERLGFNRALKYGSDMTDLGRHWTSLPRDDRRRRLDLLRPGPGEPDLRGFEWFYLRQAASRPQLQEFRAAERCVAAVAFSPDGRKLAALVRGGIEIWDVLGSRSLQRLQEKSEATRAAWLRFCPDALRFCPDGQRLISVRAHDDAGAPIKVWDIAADRALAEWPGTGTRAPAAVSPDGQSVALGGVPPEHGTVYLWVVQSGRHRVVWRRPAQGQRGGVTSVALSPAGRLLAVAYFWGEEYKIDLLELPRGEVRATTLGNHYTFIRTLAFSPDGATLASGALEYARLWDTATGRQKEPLLVGPGIVSALAFSPDNRTLAAGWQPNGAGLGEACSVSLWDVASSRRLPRELRTGCGVNALAFSPDGQSLAVGCFDDRVRLWDTGVSSDVLVVPESSPREAWSVAFSPDGQSLAVGYDDEQGGDRRTLQLWDVQTRRVRATLPGHASMVYAVTYTPDGRTVISAGHDHTVRLWEAATGQPRQTLSGHTDRVRCLACSPDGRTLATGGRDRTVRLWDLTTGNERLTLAGHTGNVHRVVFSPVGVTVASAADDGTVRVWDTATGATARLLPGTVTLNALAYAPDGRTLATADKTGLIRLWDPVTGVERARLQGHASDVPALVYSPDGKTLASGGADRTVRLWQAVTGQALLTLDGLPEYPHGLAFSRDGRTLAAALHDGTVKLWRGE
jgi:WD40 repeat protein